MINDLPLWLREQVQARLATQTPTPAARDALDKLGAALTLISSDDPIARSLEGRLNDIQPGGYPTEADWQAWEAQRFDDERAALDYLRDYYDAPAP